MKITAVSVQQKNKNRLNIMVDGAYRFSLDIAQYTDLGIKVGKEYNEDELRALETESVFGKLYARALEYSLMRPRSTKELRDYLWRKTRPVKKKSGQIEPGVPVELTERVLTRLLEKGYVNDTRFAEYWVENRQVTKGVSRRKLLLELKTKGIDQSTIDHALAYSSRDDSSELLKVIAKKRRRYPDDQKFIAYLMRQGFSYDDIKEVLETAASD